MRTARKSENLSRVRAELDHVTQIMERQIRNTDNLVCGEDDPTIDDDALRYIDPDNPAVYGYIECINAGDAVGDSYIASRSAMVDDGSVAYGNFRLTSSEIKINSCDFDCSYGGAGMPTSVSVMFDAKTKFPGIEASGDVTVETILLLRNY